ncbi:diguanylate cyclase [Rheinheimera sp. FR7-31]|uniref:diguanylate cyclase n=1 Tax=Rheinheimera fenheensis TaxID=3152295 RepID=UPI00325CF1E4
MSDSAVTDIGQFPKQATILVVDDQPINIQVAYQVLGDDYQVLMATSGQQAIKICQNNKPDLILMDVVMPEQDGLNTCRQLKADRTLADIPVLFVTGLQHQTDEDACWNAGAVDFIQKPFNANTLRNRVKVHLTLKHQADLLRNMAYVDGLTGIYNRRYFDNLLQNQLAQHKRKQSPLAVLLIDIDHFKQFNDTFGHLAGDDTLRKVALAIQESCVRPGDSVARYGGEEFVVLLSDTDSQGAIVVAEKLLKNIAKLAITHPASLTGFVSVSVGIAVAEPNDAYSGNLLDLADQQLYAAKQYGRNQYRIAPLNSNSAIDSAT